MPFGFSPDLMAALSIGLLGAAYVRGYSGFGFSALFIAFASLLTNPLPLIPVVYMCEILMTGFQARGIRGHIDWHRVGALIAGACLTLPVAIYLMTQINPDTGRLVISSVIMVMSLLLLVGWTLTTKIGPMGHACAGAVSGLCNGSGVGGLPVVAFLTAQAVPPATFRATMIIYLTILDLLTLPLMYMAGLISMDTLYAAILALPILGLGLWLGGRRFASASPDGFRRLAIILLFTLAALGILRAIYFAS